MRIDESDPVEWMLPDRPPRVDREEAEKRGWCMELFPPARGMTVNQFTELLDRTSAVLTANRLADLEASLWQAGLAEPVIDE